MFLVFFSLFRTFAGGTKQIKLQTMKRTAFAMLALMAAITAGAQYKSEVWSPDNGDGTYTNPVINADYSDPDVCVGASGEDYYMTASSFQCVPGLPILHSKDLVNWEIINYALKNLYDGDCKLLQHFSKPQHGAGVWAPSIRYHNGEYYIYWGDPDYGVYMVKTKDPAGQWSDPLCVSKGMGYIDTTPLWDDDGRCYLVNGWANSRSKFASVLTVREMSADGTRPIGQPVIVFDGNGTENRTCEGPKFYKRDGWYWIMCPAGGVPTGFQLAMRSKSPYGPYEHKIVLAQGKTKINGPHQGGWVHTKYGEDWFLHFQDKEAYGRVVHLNPVDWSTGWPIMGKKGEPVTTYQKPKSSSTVIVLSRATSLTALSLANSGSGTLTMTRSSVFLPLSVRCASTPTRSMLMPRTCGWCPICCCRRRPPMSSPSLPNYALPQRPTASSVASS